MGLRRFSIVAGVGLWLLPALAFGNSIWTEDCNLTPQSSFAYNEIVCAQGDVDTPCGGSIVGAADIWIVPTGAPDYTLAPGSLPSHIVTAGGGGGFWGEIIWLPTTTPGTYDLMIDEDCNGYWSAGDKRETNAFVVLNVDTGVVVDVTAIKNAAAAEAQRWIDIKNGWDLTVAVANLIGKVNTFASALAGDFSGLIGWVYGKATGMPTDYNGAVLQVGTKIIHGVTNNMALHWLLLAADPPDSDFQPLVTLDWSVAQAPLAADGLPAYPFALQGSTEREERIATLSGLLAEQAVLGDAFIRQFEKYQGADIAGDNGWIAVTAGRTGVLAAAMVDHFDAIDDALADLEADLQGDPSAALENDPAEFAAIQTRLTSDGLDADEVAELELYGLDSAARDALVADAIAKDLPPAPWSHLSLVQDMRATLMSTRDAYQDVVDQTAAVVAAEGAVVPPTHPVPSAGGPYVTTVGATVSLSASGSTDPDGQALTFAWDLDADGSFDDGAGATVQLSPEVQGVHLVGVTVTDASGNEAAAHARVTVAVGDLPPVIDSFTPSDLQVEVEVGASATFGVTATDPEGDLVAFEWTRDGAVVGAAGSYTFTPSADDVGLNVVRVRASDADALSRDAFEQRQVLVIPAGGGDDDDDDDAGDDDAGDDDAGDDDDAADDDDDGRRGACVCDAAAGPHPGLALLVLLALVAPLVSRRRRATGA